MKTVYKYSLPQCGVNSLQIPESHRILSVQMQFNELCVWIYVDTESKPMRKDFLVVGTGHPIFDEVNPDGYVGTVQTNHGFLVWHVFAQ